MPVRAIRFRKTRARVLIPLMILITFWQNYYDIEGIMAGEALALYQYNGPLAAKLAKDIFNVIIMFTLLWYALTKKINPVSMPFVAISCLIFGLAMFSALLNAPIIAAFGIRWILPFLIFLLLRDWMSEFDGLTTVKWLFFAMVVCFLMQLYQLFNMPPVFGELLPGVAARTPGIFIAPNSTALFACAFAAGIIVFSDNNRSWSLAAVILAILIGFACQSGTGIVCAFVLLLRLVLHKFSYWFWGIAAAMIVLIFPNLNALTGRADYVESSGGGRIDVLIKIISEAATSVGNFGVYTNSANLASQSPELMTAVDSLIASWIGNFGTFAFPALLLVYWFVKTQMKDIDWKRASPCLIVFVLFSLTSIIFEAFPMNIILAMGIWYPRRHE